MALNGFIVLTPGALTTIQDLGRQGYQELGIPVSGAFDRFACKVANGLVGNRPGKALLEVTVAGPTLAALQKMDVAFAGADMKMTLNHEPVDPWRSFQVNPGDVLAIPMVKRGCRGYLSVGGGFDVPKVMGSRCTYLSGKLGGIDGRPLQKGDFLPVASTPLMAHQRHLADEFRPRYSNSICLRAIVGPQTDVFMAAIDRFFETRFTLGSRADRMGCRLDGEAIFLDSGKVQSIISEPIMPGSVQIPPDGHPIILLGEQTTGGYAKIATVISADLPCLAQAVPGDAIRFESVDLETGYRVCREDAGRMARIQQALAISLGTDQ